MVDHPFPRPTAHGRAFGAPQPTRPGRWARLAVAISVIAIAAAACGSGSSPGPTAAAPTGGIDAPATAAANSATPGARTRLVVGLGYIPSVQFAQFYYADQAGYYAAAGLDVEFQNKIDPELIALVGQGAIDIGIADGTSVIPAVGQGIPVRYLMTIYAQFPNVVVAKGSSGITTAADLKGRKIGIPGRFGSSWIHLQALLAGAGLTPADTDIVPFPDFGQVAALEKGAVDAAAGYVNNEPIRLAQAGATPVSLLLPPDQGLPGPGLIAGNATLTAKRGAILAFAEATLRAMDELAANPEKGLEAAVARIPELGTQRDVQLAVLRATTAVWESDYTRANGTGAVDPALWERSITFMAGLPDKLLARTPSVAECIEAGFLPRQ